MRSGDPAKPLFLIHPIGGHVYCYKPLVDCLDYSGAIYGIEAPEITFRTIEEIAAHYIKTIRFIQPQGPYSFFGASFGGLISFEIARQLREAGHSIHLLAMADILRPEEIPSRDADLISLLIELFEGKESAGLFLSPTDQMQRLIQSMHLESAPLTEQKRIVEKVKLHLEALSRYRPRKYTGKAHFFEAQERFIRQPTLSLGESWKDLFTEGIEIYDIPGNHLTILTMPHVAKMSRLLAVCLSK